jgi:hypothetical protein
MNNCPTCHKPYAHTLGVMGYAGPPFWCECIHQPKLPHKDNLLEGMVDWASKHTVSQEEAKERLSRFDKLPSSLPDETEVKFLEERIAELTAALEVAEGWETRANALADALGVLEKNFTIATKALDRIATWGTCHGITEPGMERVAKEAILSFEVIVKD